MGYIIWVTLYGSNYVAHILLVILGQYMYDKLMICAKYEILVNLNASDGWVDCDKYCKAHGCATRIKVEFSREL